MANCKCIFSKSNDTVFVHETQSIICSFGPFHPYFHKVGFC
jgi:hypothetical protein